MSSWMMWEAAPFCSFRISCWLALTMSANLCVRSSCVCACVCVWHKLCCVCGMLVLICLCTCLCKYNYPSNASMSSVYKRTGLMMLLRKLTKNCPHALSTMAHMYQSLHDDWYKQDKPDFVPSRASRLLVGQVTEEQAASSQSSSLVLQTGDPCPKYGNHRRKCF